MGESRQRNRTRTTILLSIMVLLLGVLAVRHFLALTRGGLELEKNRSRSIFKILQSTGGPGEELSVLTNDFRSSLVLIEAQKQLAGATHLVRQGSGIVVARGGWIVTSYRLIAGADRVGYRIEGGDWRPARVEASDSLTDIALLRDPDPPWRLTPAFLSDRTRFTPGEWILCLGHPAGLEFSTTWGIVSSGERREGPFALQRLLQTDAAINEGCAGGALIDLDGNVVGMVSVSFSPNGGNVGINFAVPASVLRRVVPELARQGRVRRGWLGVTVGEPDRDAMEALGMRAGVGAEVAGVERGSPGERAGLTEGDILLRIDGEPVQGPSDLFDRIAGSRPGEEIDVEWLHGGKRIKARVRLEERGSV